MASDLSEFGATTVKAWDRSIELYVYDPATEGNPNLGLSKGEAMGVEVSALHVEFQVKRSRTFSENTAEFKIYNANPEHRTRMTTPGMHVRFSAGYVSQGGPKGIFWGVVTAGAESQKKGTDWVTRLVCVSNLSASMGSEDIVQAAAKAKTTDEKQALQTRAINRIPVALGYIPGTPASQVLRDLQTITGLAVLGSEGVTGILLKNGFNYSGGVRGALDAFLKTCLKPAGWTFHIDNNSLFVYPLDDKIPYVVTSAFLTTKGYTKGNAVAQHNTGYISHTPKTKSNVPPKMAKGKDGKMHPVPMPRTYEVKCLLNPKIAPNTLATIEVPGLDTTLLVDSVEFEGNNFGGGFTATFEGHVYDGAGR